MRTPIIFCRFFYTLLLSTFSPVIYAQDYSVEWLQTAGGSQWDEFNKVIKTSDGGLIAIGKTYSNDYDVEHNNGNSDVWVQKFTLDGELIWSKTYGGSLLESGYDIVENEDGTFMLACRTNSMDGDVSVNKGNYDVWLVHISAVGDLIYEYTYGGSNHDEPAGIIKSEDGGYVIGGFTGSSDGDVIGLHGEPPFDDYWIFKINAAGEILWQNCLGSSGDEQCSAIIQSLDNGYLLNGFSNANGEDVTGNHFSYDMWVVKVDSIGELLWQRSLGGYGTDEGESIVCLADSTIISSGTTFSNDGDIEVLYGLEGAWLVRLDINGNTIWSTTYGGSVAEVTSHVINISPSEIIFIGSSLSNDWMVDENYGDGDAWVVSVDTSGLLNWEKNFGGTISDQGKSIIEITPNVYVFCGLTRSSDIDIATNYGDFDSWITKISLCEEIFFRDTDEDGYGNSDSLLIACDIPVGYVTDSTDCNDTDSLIYPGATEICNHLDDDCDGITDDYVSLILAYQDSDSDNFGNPLVDSLSCDLPEGYILDNTDCNDTNPEIYPGAEELLNGIDDDCDQMVDEGLSIDEIPIIACTISPNPSFDKIIITSNINGDGEYTITSILGQVLVIGSWNSANNSINIENIPAGIYTINLHFNKAKDSLPFIKLD